MRQGTQHRCDNRRLRNLVTEKAPATPGASDADLAEAGDSAGGGGGKTQVSRPELINNDS